MRELIRIKVKKGNQIFWVYNPKKIKYWLKQAEYALRYAGGQEELANVKILRKVYK